ncbi:MAG TPA: VOC family protein [Ohtaekwangia sp.]|nr:VOC family protein [Ohtaekwangia sp.]
MLKLANVHHIAIICSDYEKSRRFYTEVLGFKILSEHYRTERNSFKLDLALNERYTIELFSFPEAPPRVTRPEATGLRHLAFTVEDVDHALHILKEKGIATEPVRVDPYTSKRFLFFRDPDELPIELYER